MLDLPRLLLAVGWGALLAAPLVQRAHRVSVAERCGLSHDRATARTRRRVLVGAREVTRRVIDATGPVARVARAFLGRRHERAANRALERELPVALDLLGVAVGAGCTPYLAVEVAARWAPPVVAALLDTVLAKCSLGAGFEAALDDVARAVPRLEPLRDALLASDRLGAPVGDALARLAAEERAALRRRAEAHARKVPVRLLFPLVFLVLPAFVLLTVVPGLAAGLSRL
jgi:pilus assembly protein TadC